MKYCDPEIQMDFKNPVRRHSTQNSLNSQSQRTSAGSAVSALIVVVLFAAESLALAQAPQLTVASAVPDPSGQTVTITGANFGNRPLVTLDLLPVTVQFAVDSQIVAAVPVNMMPAGTYLLTVSRGSLPTDSASIQVALGGGLSAQPAAPREPVDLPDTTRMPNAADRAAQVGDRVITVARGRSRVAAHGSQRLPRVQPSAVRQSPARRRPDGDRRAARARGRRRGGSRQRRCSPKEIPKRIVDDARVGGDVALSGPGRPRARRDARAAAAGDPGVADHASPSPSSRR